MKIFISYAHEDKAIAKKIQLKLTQKGHDVFLDSKRLVAGRAFDSIEREIKERELFIFLISPDSLAEGTFALSELGCAEEKWADPTDHVLPVVVRRTSQENAYLDLVTRLEPQGDISFEVARAVEKLTDAEANEGKSGGKGFWAELAGAIVTGLQNGQTSSSSGAAPALARTSQLEQVLPGAWQIQLTYPNRMTGQAGAQLYGNGSFQAQGVSPYGRFGIEGSWQLIGAKEILLSGQQSLNYQVAPFTATIQFSQVTSNMLVGVMSSGESVVWNRTG